MATEHATEPEPVEAPLEQPPPAYKNFVPTLNAQGFMTETLDPVSAEWVAFAASPQCAALGPALDCGAAYGTATLRALRADAADTDAGTAAGTGAGGGGGGEEGARVVANDLDERHLQILWEKADAAARRRLRLLPGRFPEAVHAALSGDAGGEDKEAVSFPMPTLGGVGAVLVCRVLHFFDGDGVRDAIQRIAQWLAPGGKAFLVAETPYLKNMQETCAALRCGGASRLPNSHRLPCVVAPPFRAPLPAPCAASRRSTSGAWRPATTRSSGRATSTTSPHSTQLEPGRCAALRAARRSAPPRRPRRAPAAPRAPLSLTRVLRRRRGCPSRCTCLTPQCCGASASPRG